MTTTIMSSSSSSVYDYVQYQGQSGTLTLTGDSLSFQADLPRRSNHNQQQQEQQPQQSAILELVECSNIVKVKATAANSHANWLRLEYTKNNNNDNNNSNTSDTTTGGELLLMFCDRSHLERARRDIHARRRIFGALFSPSSEDAKVSSSEKGHAYQYYNHNRNHGHFTPPRTTARRSASLPSPRGGRPRKRSSSTSKPLPRRSHHSNGRSSTKTKKQQQPASLEPSETESMTTDESMEGIPHHNHHHSWTVGGSYPGVPSSISSNSNNFTMWGHSPLGGSTHGQQPQFYPMIAYVTSPPPHSTMPFGSHSVPCSPIRVHDQKVVLPTADQDTRVVLDFSQLVTMQTIAVSREPQAQQHQTPVQQRMYVTPVTCSTTTKKKKGDNTTSLKMTSNQKESSTPLDSADEFDTESIMIAQRRQESKRKTRVTTNKEPADDEDPSNTTIKKDLSWLLDKEGDFELFGISMSYMCCAGIWWVVCCVALFCIVLPTILIAVIVSSSKTGN